MEGKASDAFTSDDSNGGSNRTHAVNKTTLGCLNYFFLGVPLGESMFPKPPTTAQSMSLLARRLRRKLRILVSRVTRGSRETKQNRLPRETQRKRLMLTPVPRRRGRPPGTSSNNCASSKYAAEHPCGMCWYYSVPTSLYLRARRNAVETCAC